jgi:hypothetical protein
LAHEQKENQTSLPRGAKPALQQVRLGAAERLGLQLGWFTDDSFGQHYLHVYHKDGDSIHRVKCRGHDKPRLEMRKGKLMWLYEL